MAYFEYHKHREKYRYTGGLVGHDVALSNMDLLKGHNFFLWAQNQSNLMALEIGIKDLKFERSWAPNSFYGERYDRSKLNQNWKADDVF